MDHVSMDSSIPLTEPTAARAGDTWTWQRSLPAYPAGVWTLGYTLFSANGAINLTATANGTDHRIYVAPATTGAYTAGRYDWLAYVSDGTDRFQIGTGALHILPQITTSAHDARSHARKVLEALEATIEGRATSGDLDVIETTFGDRSIKRDLAGLLKLRSQYQQMVAMEAASARIGAGLGGQLIGVRFRG